MSQQKRFGKRVATPSTLQIREHKILVRHDAEPVNGDADAGASQDDAIPAAEFPSHLVAR